MMLLHTISPNHPECTRCLQIAFVHIFGDAAGAGGKVFTADTTTDEFRKCMTHPHVRQAEAQAYAGAASGDVVATKAACQAWAKAYRMTFRQLRTEEVA